MSICIRSLNKIRVGKQRHKIKTMKEKHLYIYYTLLVTVFLLNGAEIQAQEQTDSLVNVAFGTVAKNDLLGGISTVNISNLLEKNYYTNVTDGLQSYVGGYTGDIWGQSALVLVDGIPRRASDVNPTEVESITVLKGASAVVLYGSKGAKGVILITTKRGEEKPLTIDVRANTGLYFPKSYPKFLNAAEYMTLHNEASRNDGIAERYDDATIYNTAVGGNKYRYPDIDFFNSEYLRNVYNKTDLTAEVSGGNRWARYYTNFGMSYNNSLMKYGAQKNNNDLNFNVRANVDMNLTDWLRASTNALVIINNNYTGRGNFWGSTASLRPNWFSPLIPVEMLDTNNNKLQTYVENSNHLIDGKYLLGGTSADMTNTFSDMLAAGYIKNKNRAFLFDLNVGADLGKILKGLSFKTAFGVDYTNFYSEAYKLDYAVYEPTWSNMNGKDVIIDLTKYNEDKKSISEFVGSSEYTQTMTFSAQFDYKRSFDNIHNISATLLGWGYQRQNSNDEDHEGSDYHKDSNVNLGLQANYNYLHKYYIDFSGAMVHSAKLPEGNRQAFSPTVSAGWRLSNEDFFSENISFVNNLKLNASYGKLNQDIDIDGYYLYQGYFKSTNWYQWRDGNAGGNTVSSARGDNMNLGFIQRKEFRIGMEAGLFNDAIMLDANYFKQDTKGLITTGVNTIYPSYFNAGRFNLLSYTNFENDRRTGLDFNMKLNKKIAKVDVSLGFSGMFYSSEALLRDEMREYDYQNRAGKPLDASWGLISEGFFQDEEDIANHATQTYGTVRPGDLKYRDVNEDGIIDSKDEVYLGRSGWSAPPFSYGLNLTLKWKNFTFFALGTGVSGAVRYKNNSYYWIRGNSKYSEVVWNRWTEETKDTATYPRLTTTDNSNNFRQSTFWQYKNNRFDLSKVQLTYEFPKQLFSNIFLNDMSVYISGENLLVLSKEREMMERNVGSAPQNRFFNIGFTTSF